MTATQAQPTAKRWGLRSDARLIPGIAILLYLVVILASPKWVALVLAFPVFYGAAGEFRDLGYKMEGRWGETPLGNALLMNEACLILFWCPALFLLIGLNRPFAVITVACSAVADVGAIVVGKPFGRHKLARTISPGKTWEGALGGIIASMLAAWSIATLWGWDVSLWRLLPAAFLMTVGGIAGDILESKIKRLAGVKNSGSLLFGHGGVLDRFDANFAAAFIGVVILLTPWI